MQSAFCHPVVFDYLGKGRYLQAAASRSLARLYSDRFGTSTSRNLSNKAAESGSQTFLDWTRSIGCNWNESVFLSGVEGGRTDILQHLIDNGCPVPQGEDACTCAAKEGRLGALMWLRERGFAWDKEVCSEAAARGDLPLLEWAREHGCVCDSQDVLEWAARFGHLSILEWGQQQGVELTEMMTAFAAAGGFIHVLEWLRAHEGPWHTTTVWHAASYGHCHVYAWLKDAGCPYDVNIADLAGTTGLHWATRRGFVDIARMLIEDGADVNQPMYDQTTALHLAALSRRCEIVQILVDADAYVNAKTQMVDTPLVMAAEAGFLDVVRILLRAGPGVELNGMKSPLTAAACNNRIDVVRALLTAGANPNHQNAKCTSPLYWACKQNYVEVARALIDGGADVNQPSAVWRMCPIHMAARGGHAQLLSILIKHGADVNVSASKGETPLSLAKAGKHTKVVEILRVAGATQAATQDFYPRSLYIKASTVGMLVGVLICAALVAHLWYKA